MNRVTRKLDEGEQIRDLPAYLYGVARILVVERLKRRAREQAALTLMPPPVAAAGESDRDDDVRRACFERCVRRLPTPSRELIIQYYQEAGGGTIARRKKLAAALGVGLNALRIRAHRIRAALEAEVRACIERQQAGVGGSRETDLRP